MLVMPQNLLPCRGFGNLGRERLRVNVFPDLTKDLRNVLILEKGKD
jgi:hypothetical protein